MKLPQRALHFGQNRYTMFFVATLRQILNHKFRGAVFIMKKLCSLFSVIVLIFVLTGCGNSNGNDGQAETQYDEIVGLEYDLLEDEVDEHDAESFIVDFSVLMHQQGSHSMHVLTYWAEYVTERWLQDGVRLHHISPYFYDEIYITLQRQKHSIT